MSEENVVMSDVAIEDMRSALEILESIHFLVGPELLRKDVTRAIQHLKHGLAVEVVGSKVLSSLNKHERGICHEER